LDNYVIVFIDDILVYSKDEASHAIHLRKVLELLGEHDLRAKYSKCHFCESEVRFLGHVINQDRIGVDLEKVRAVGEWKRPEMISVIRSFFGDLKSLIGAPSVRAHFWSGKEVDIRTRAHDTVLRGKLSGAHRRLPR